MKLLSQTPTIEPHSARATAVLGAGDRPPCCSRQPGSSPSPPQPAVDVEIVIPTYNEQRALASSIRRLHRFLSNELPFSWRIVIADNASTDATPTIAGALADELPGVETLCLQQKGRGRALRAAWASSSARVVCYMDVDLSTDLKALLPLIAPLFIPSERAGDRHTTGTRGARHARTQARAHLPRLQHATASIPTR